VVVLLLAVWAYFADKVIDCTAAASIEYPVIGNSIAGVVPVIKVWVFLIGALFYFLVSTMAQSRFIGWLGSMLVMTEIFMASPLQKLKGLVDTAKAKNASSAMALERYGVFPWKSSETWVRMLSYIAGVLFVFLLVYFIVIIIKDRNAKNTTRKTIRNSVVLLVIIAVFTFIPGLLLGTGPVWMFIGLMALITLISYMYGTIKRSRKDTPVIAAAVTIVLMVTLSILDLFYRTGLITIMV